MVPTIGAEGRCGRGDMSDDSLSKETIWMDKLTERERELIRNFGISYAFAFGYLRGMRHEIERREGREETP